MSLRLVYWEPKGKQMRFMLIPSELSDLVTKQLSDLVRNKQLFTIRDITNIIRKKLPDYEILHEDVKKYVEREIQQDTVWTTAYTYTLWPNWQDPYNLAPRIFHPTGVPVTDYFNNTTTTQPDPFEDLIKYASKL